MALSNMVVYDEQIRLRTIELLAENMQVFNGQSRNALVLTADSWMGGLSKESFYSQIVGAQRRVDRNAVNADVAAIALSEKEKVKVKVAGGYGPIIFEPSQLTWLESSPAEAIDAIAAAFADALLADQVHTAVGVAVAALGNNSAANVDVSTGTGGAGALTQAVLNKSHALFGDASSTLLVDVMSGAAYHKLIEKGLANGEQLFSAADVMVQSIQGKTFVVADVPALTDGDKTKVLSIAANGVVCDNANKITTVMETKGGKERIETTWQADYEFGLGLKGYTWAGGTSPLDAELMTGANWAQSASSIKNTAGTLAIADITQ